MILARLFGALFAAGVVVVATSNVAPDELYKDGLNRALFLPFLGLLGERMAVFELGARLDYRLQKLARAPVYYCPDDASADAAMDAAFSSLTGQPRGARASCRCWGGRSTSRRRWTASRASASTISAGVRSARRTSSRWRSISTPS